MIHRFRRSAVGHFGVGTSSTTVYSGVGDTWTFSLAAGLTSVLGKFIDSAPDTTSTVANIAIPSSSEFTNLFDLYRFRNVHIQLIPLLQPLSESASTPKGSASMWMSLNEKNAGAISSLVELLQREDVRYELLEASNNIQFDYKPKPLLDANAAGTATAGVTSESDDWLSTAALDVATHSGIRVFFDTNAAAATTTVQTVIVFITFDLEFKCVI